MRSKLHLIGGVLAISLCGVALAQPDPVGPLPPDAPIPDDAPRISLGLTEHQFGKIADDQIQHTVIPFSNTGKSTLVIRDVRSECSCTAAKPQKLEYSPGESGEIDVSFDPHGRQGAQHRTVTVFTNDPVSPATTFVIEADVVKMIDVVPPIVRMLSLPRHQTRTFMVDIFARADGFEITNATLTRGENIDVDVLPAEDIEINGETLRRASVLVTFLDTLPIGNAQGAVTIRSTDKSGNIDIKTVALIGDVVGDLYPGPAQINMGAVPGGATFNRIITLNSRAETKFKIVGIEERPFSTPAGESRPPVFSHLEFDAALPPVKDGVQREDTYLIRVTGDIRPEIDGQFFTELVFVTDRTGDDQRIPVRVIGRVRTDADQLQPAATVGGSAADHQGH
ncbi:MAG: DUF1573 domain-containing protein [Phycisphaeraceae bacterium]|nr:DUF1573 domain-containing protein [Phycisphaeraceae bacterium]